MNKEYLQKQFNRTYGCEPSHFFSAPGRTELIGNHSDHQHGRVLSSAIKQSVYAAVEPSNDGIIRIASEGYEPFEIELSDLSIHPEEIGTTASLVRGVAAGFESPKAFRAFIYSDVPAGKGLSSSAAFEVLIARILNELGECGLSEIDIASIGMNAENKYYGKPCGMQDQTISSVGKTVMVDFFDPANPHIEEMPYDPRSHGYALCIMDTGASHDDLTDDFSSIIEDMAVIAKHYGEEHLRHISKEQFFAEEKMLAKKYGKNVTDRAHHFLLENKRVADAAEALKADNFEEFLRLVNESGRSSENYLRNIVSSAHPERSEVADTLALIAKLLDGAGAYRVHGGGFAGTTQAYVPVDKLDYFRKEIETVLGEGSCLVIF